MSRLFQWFFILFPAVFSLQTSQHFELPKVAFFLVAGCGLIAFVRAYEILTEGNFTVSIFKRAPWFFAAVLVYLLYLILYTFFALTPEVSFWGSYERHQGLFLVLGIVFFMGLILTRVWKKEEIYQLLHGIMAGGLVVSLTALWQFFSPEPFGGIGATLGRIYGAAGHPNFLGQLLLVPLLLHIFFIFREQESEKWKKILLRSSFFIQVCTLLATENRASIAAFLIGLLLIGLYSYKSMLTEEVRQRLKPYLIKALLLLVSIVLFYISFKMFDGAFSRSILTRAYLFPYVLQMIMKSPLMGYGLDSFSYAFSPFFPLGMGETENFTNMPDRAHNEVLDLLSEQGIIGLVCALICMAFLFRYVRQFFLRTTKTAVEERLLICVLIVVLTALELSYLAGFSTTVTKVSAGVVLSLIFAYISIDHTFKVRKGFVIPAGIVIAVLGSIFTVSGYRIYMGDVLYADAREGRSTNLLIQSIDMSPYKYEYLVFGSDLLTEPEDKLHFIEKAEGLNTHDYFVYLQMGRAYALLKNQEKALESFNKAEILCPNCPLIPLYAGEAVTRMGNPEEAKKYFDKYMNLTPSFYKKVYIDKVPESSLSSYEKERLRIFLKENKEYLDFVEAQEGN